MTRVTWTCPLNGVRREVQGDYVSCTVVYSALLALVHTGLEPGTISDLCLIPPEAQTE